MQSQAICLLASREAKGGTGMVALAGQYLNLVLEDLKLKRDLKINRVTQSLTVSTGTYGPFALEADYLRTYDLWYPLQTPNGTTMFLDPITMEQWDEEFKSTPTSNYPYEFATDLSTRAQVWSGGAPGNGTLTSAGQLFIYPQTTGTIVLTHRYMKNQPDLLAPESSTLTPWFDYSMYLITETAGRLMGVTGDERQQQYLERAEKMLRPYLIMEGDEQKAVHEVKLDPRHFRSKRGVRPTKVNPY